MIETLNHINELIEINKRDFKHSNFLAIKNEISKIEDIEIKEKLSSKLLSIYNNRINGKGVIRDNELEQVIKEFNEMQDIIKNYIENIKSEDISENIENLENPIELEENILNLTNESEENFMENENIIPEEQLDKTLEKRADIYDIQRKSPVQRRREILKEKLELADDQKFLTYILDKKGNRVYSDEDIKNMHYYEIKDIIYTIENADPEKFEEIMNMLNEQKFRNYLTGIVDFDGNRKYTDEEINNMTMDEVTDIWEDIVDNNTEDEIEEIKNRARLEEAKRNKKEPDPTPDDISNVTEDNLEDLINKYKEQLTKDTPIEEAKIIIDRINDAILEMYKKEQNKFESDLKNATTLESKLEVIEKRESRLKEYENYYKFEQELNADTIAYIEESKQKIVNELNKDYNNKKQNGEYCWKEFTKVNESKKYIDENIKDDLRTQFNDLTEKMYDIVNNPTQEEYDNWKNSMNKFVNNAKLDREKITPYLTAQLQIKYPDKNLSVDKNFDIDGLGLTKTTPKEPVPTPVKKRAKVKKVEKGIGAWFKRHKNKLILIGLGLALTTLLVYQIPAVQMMINSALWGIGKAKGTLTAIELANLHSANTALSNIVTGGRYAFEAGSGLYTIGGKVGAQALYNAGQAGLVNSLMNIAGYGGLGLAGSGLVTAIVEKIQNWKKKKNGEDIEIDEPEIGEDEPTVTNEDELVIGPLEKDLENLFTDCKIALHVDTTDGPGYLLAPKDATEEQIDKAIKSGKTGVGTYVISTELSRKIIDKYNKQKGKKKDDGKEPELTREELLEIIKKQEERIKKQEETIEEYKKMVEDLKKGLISTQEEKKEIKEGTPEHFGQLIEQLQQMDPEQQKKVAEIYNQQAEENGLKR